MTFTYAIARQPAANADEGLTSAGLGSDTREAPPDSGGAATDTITPEDETQPGNGGRDERDGGGGDRAFAVGSAVERIVVDDHEPICSKMYIKLDG